MSVDYLQQLTNSQLCRESIDAFVGHEYWIAQFGTHQAGEYGRETAACIATVTRAIVTWIIITKTIGDAVP